MSGAAGIYSLTLFNPVAHNVALTFAPGQRVHIVGSRRQVSWQCGGQGSFAVGALAQVALSHLALVNPTPWDTGRTIRLTGGEFDLSDSSLSSGVTIFANRGNHTIVRCRFDGGKVLQEGDIHGVGASLSIIN